MPGEPTARSVGGASGPGPRGLLARLRRPRGGSAGAGTRPALTLRLAGRLAGRTTRTRDWSLTGLTLPDGAAELVRGEQVSAHLKVPGGPRGRARLEVTALRPDGGADLRFLEIATDCFLALAEHPAAAGRAA